MLGILGNWYNMFGRVFQAYTWSSLLVKEHGHNFGKSGP